jgi:hypothetical protein
MSRSNLDLDLDLDVDVDLECISGKASQTMWRLSADLLGSAHTVVAVRVQVYVQVQVQV